MVMARMIHRFQAVSLRRCRVWLLTLSWSGGLLCGILGFATNWTVPADANALCQVSVGDLMTANLLPFLFSVFAVYIHKPLLILPIAFLRGCLFSFVSMGVMASFGSGGWLVRFLLMFSDVLLTVLLYFYWMRHISGLRRFSCLQSAAMAAAVVLVGSVDYCWITPILGRVL